MHIRRKTPNLYVSKELEEDEMPDSSVSSVGAQISMILHSDEVRLEKSLMMIILKERMLSYLFALILGALQMKFLLKRK